MKTLRTQTDLRELIQHYDIQTTILFWKLKIFSRVLSMLSISPLRPYVFARFWTTCLMIGTIWTVEQGIKYAVQAQDRQGTLQGQQYPNWTARYALQGWSLAYQSQNWRLPFYMQEELI